MENNKIILLLNKIETDAIPFTKRIEDTLLVMKVVPYIFTLLLLTGCGAEDRDLAKSIEPGDYIHVKRVSPSQKFTVQHSQIFSPSGQPFIIKGTNTFPEHSRDFEAIANCWGFNAIRINHMIDNAWYDISEIDSMVQLFTKHGLVVVLDLAHDSPDNPTSGIGEYWLDRKAELSQLYYTYASRYKNNPYVWFDLVNEPGGINYDVYSWLDIHQTLIRTIRDAAENPHPILVQGWCWGQDACSWHSDFVLEAQSAILSYGQDIKSFNNKHYDNIIFSIHVYDQWGDSARLINYIDRARNAGHGLLIGEYGYNANDSQGPLKSVYEMFKALESRDIGTFFWTWYAFDDSDLSTNIEVDGSGSGVNSCATPTNLTELGRLVWRYIK